MKEKGYWGNFLLKEDFEKQFDNYLNEKVQKRADDADFFIDILIEQGVIKLDKAIVKSYFIKWFFENKDFDLQIENGDFVMEDNDLKFVPDFDKNDLISFVQWFNKEKNEFIEYLKQNGVDIKEENNNYTSTVNNAENVIINNNSNINSQTVLGNNEKKKWEKSIIISLIGLTLAILVALFGNNWYGRLSNENRIEKIKDSLMQNRK
jgi:hypothetical protein